MSHTILATEDSYDLLTENEEEIILDTIGKLSITFTPKTVGIDISESQPGIEFNE